MGDLFLLSARQMARISPFFPWRMACHVLTTAGW